MSNSEMIDQAVILCGGKGTRLGNLAKDVPKPLIPVAGKPLLDRSIELLAEHGITKALLVAGHLGEQIEQHYASGRHAGVEIEVFIEPEALGTAGALPLIEDRLEQFFLLVYGDVFIDFDVSRLVAAHGEWRGAGAVATLLTRESDHPWDSHLVDVGENGWVREFVFQQETGQLYKNVGNVAIYVCERALLNYIPKGQASDFGRNVFPAALGAKAKIAALDLEPGGFVRDMGTPDRLALVEQYLERKGRSEAAIAHRKPPRVAFLDRDGTLNVERGLIRSAEELELLPGAGEAVARLNDAGWRCFVLTNQPVLARGFCSEEDLAAIHARLEDLLREKGGCIEQIYYSPFHPETHHGEGVKELRRGSDCRKPGAGMLYQAEEDHGLDLAEVVMIGDTWRDILAGQSAGVRTVLVGDAFDDGADLADLVVRSLSEAVDQLLTLQHSNQ